MMGDLLPGDVTRLIYLDCDILVRQPLGELWMFDLKDAVLAGAEDWGVWRWRKQKHFFFPFDRPYINAGVLLVDLEKWRVQKCGERCLAYMRKPDYPVLYEDQDVLNFVLRESIIKLPVKWNTMLCFSAEELRQWWFPASWLEALRNPSLVHFTSPEKPWLADSCLPYAYEFQAHMRALGLALKRTPVKKKLEMLVLYWWKHPVFFLKPKFWKTWRGKKWGTFV